jgi:hypothetical protein
MEREQTKNAMNNGILHYSSENFNEVDRGTARHTFVTVLVWLIVEAFTKMAFFKFGLSFK